MEKKEITHKNDSMLSGFDLVIFDRYTNYCVDIIKRVYPLGILYECIVSLYLDYFLN